MHAIPFNSSEQLVARLCGKYTHSNPKPKDKIEGREAKKRLREYREAIAAVLWGPMHEGGEL